MGDILHNNMLISIFIVFIAVLLATILILMVITTSSSDDAVITVLEKFNVPDTPAQYLVVDTDKNVYTTNIQIFDTLDEGRTYLIRTSGVRMYVLKKYPEIIKVTQSTSLETNACYLAGVANAT
jgi:hypothetical protein